MFDIIFFLVFGAVLYLTLLGDIIMQALSSLFGFEVGLTTYFVVFGTVGIITRLFYEIPYWIKSLRKKD